jgi:AcrR family transcriptional regulator
VLRLYDGQIRCTTKKESLVTQRRAQIISAAIDVFVKKGYEGTTMSQIAELCGISKGNLYNYVGSKEDLVYLIQDSVVENYERKLGVIEERTANLNVAETLRQYIRAYIETVDEMQDAYNFLNHVVVRLGKGGRHRLFRGSIAVQEDFELVLVRGMKAGKFSIQNPKLMAHNVVHLGTAWAHNRWNLRKYIGLEDYIKQQTEYILRAIGASRDSYAH